MEWHKYLKLLYLSVACTVLAWGVAPGPACSGNAVEVTRKGDTAVQETKKSAYQRRQEARKRLAEAIEQRKNLRSTVIGKTAPAPVRKGGVE